MRMLTLVALVAYAGTATGYAQERSHSDAVSKIEAMEHVWAQAYVVKDSKALDRILDRAFISVDSSGRLLNKAEILADVKRSTAMQVLTESLVVHLHADTAIVTGIFLRKGVESGKPFSRRERFVDTWLYKNGQWVSIASLVTATGD
jgi:hypothetical protein